MQCFTSWQELHDEVEIDGILEGVIHLDNPLVIGLDEHVPIRSHVGNLEITGLVRIRKPDSSGFFTHLLLPDHVCLSENLHCVNMTRIDFLN